MSGSPMDLGTLIEQYVHQPSDVLTRAYVRLRDQRDELTQQAKLIAGKLAILEKVFQRKLDILGQDSFNAGGMNVSTSTLVTYVVTDREAFFEYVIENGLYDLLEARASKEAVDIFKTNYDALPIGVDKNEKVRVSVKKSTAKVRGKK